MVKQCLYCKKTLVPNSNRSFHHVSISTYIKNHDAIGVTLDFIQNVIE